MRPTVCSTVRTGPRCAFSISSPRPAKRTRPAILVIAYPDQRRQPGRLHLESTLNEEGTEEWDATHKLPGNRYCCCGWPGGCCYGRRRARCLDCCSTNRPAPASQRARPSGWPDGEAIIRQPKWFDSAAVSESRFLPKNFGCAFGAARSGAVTPCRTRSGQRPGEGGRNPQTTRKP
jgi:hypothetical protein